MSFEAPLFLLGLGGAAIPVVIHLVGRRRAPRIRFAAMEFVLRSNRKVARQLRLRQLLLLLLRMLLAAGIAVMVARPFTEAASDLPAVGGGQQCAVVVLDDTLSMSRRQEGEVLFDRARSKAQELVRMLGARADLAVLLLSDPSGPLPVLTRDQRKVRSVISRQRVGLRHADVRAALLRAGQILSDSVLPQKRIFLITDMAAHGWPAKPPLLPDGVKLHTIDLSSSRMPPNRAVVELTASPSLAPGPRSMRLEARICNHSGVEETARVKLEVDGEDVARSLLRQTPWSCQPKVFHHTFARGGTHTAVVRIQPDDLPADDRRYLRVELEAALRVMLVNGAPSPVRHLDELFYLETALHAAGATGQVIMTTVVLADELPKVHFQGQDVVVLCNVASVPESRSADLETFVRKGGGLLVAVGHRVDPARLNRSLEHLLPQPLRGPTTASLSGAGEGIDLRFGRVTSHHPIIAALFADATGGGLRSARFSRVFRLRPDTRTERKVVIWYDDDSPALLEAQRGEGRVLLFTSTLDRDWTNLPIRPGFLPLVHQMVRHLSRTAQRAPHRDVEVGDQLAISFSRAVQEVRLEGPEGMVQLWSATRLGGRRTLEIPVTRPGFHQLGAAAADGVFRPLERESFAANVNARESDLRQASAPPSGTRRDAPAARATHRVELWHGLGVLLLLLLLGETYLIRRS